MYWINKNTGIVQTVKWHSTHLEYLCTQPYATTLHNEIPYKPWEVAGANIFMVNNKNLLCIINYVSKFPVVKMAGSLLAKDLAHATKMTFAKF